MIIIHAPNRDIELHADHFTVKTSGKIYVYGKHSSLIGVYNLNNVIGVTDTTLCAEEVTGERPD